MITRCTVENAFKNWESCKDLETLALQIMDERDNLWERNKELEKQLDYYKRHWEHCDSDTPGYLSSVKIAEQQAKIDELEEQSKKDWNGSIIQRQNKEIFQLVKTLEESRLQIQAQKKALNLVKEQAEIWGSVLSNNEGMFAIMEIVESALQSAAELGDK